MKQSLTKHILAVITGTIAGTLAFFLMEYYYVGNQVLNEAIVHSLWMGLAFAGGLILISVIRYNKQKKV